ncbi:MAG: hypothetical protein AAGK78_00080 [Planctomycetota bacterium]
MEDSHQPASDASRPHITDEDLNDASAPAPLRQPTPKKKKPRWGRRLLIAGGVVVVGLGGLVALGPTLLSTGPGNGLVQRIVNGQINGFATIEGLSLGWTSGIRVDSLELQDIERAKIIEAADLQTGFTALNALRGSLDFGDVSGRVNIVKLHVYEDGSTNLDEIYVSDSEEPTDLSTLAVNAKLDVQGTAQYVGTALDTQADRDAGTADDSPVINFDMTGLTLTAAPGERLATNVPLAFEVGGEDAGAVRLTADVDLDSLESETPSASASVSLDNVKAEALQPLLIAAGQEFEVGGTASGELTLDAQTGQFDGDVRVALPSFATLPPAGEEPSGYDGENASLQLAGSLVGRIVTLESLVASLDADTPDAATLRFAATLELPEPAENASPDDAVDLLALLVGVSDIDFALESDFFQASGSGEKLLSTPIAFTGDLAKVKARFGDLLDLGPLVATGVVSGSAKVQNAPTPAGTGAVVTFNVLAQDLLYADEEGKQLPIDRFDATVIAGPLNALPAAFESPDDELEPVVPFAKIDATLTDGGTGEVAKIDARIVNLNADSQVFEALELNGVTVNSYARLRTLLADYAELPEPTQDIENITLAGAFSYDGTTFAIAEQGVKVNAGGAELLTVTGGAALADTVTVEDLQLRLDDLMPVGEVAKRLGILEKDATDLVGALSVSFSGTLDPASEQMLASAVGDGELFPDGLQYEGLNVTGPIRFVVEDGMLTVLEPDNPLEINTGQGFFAGATYNLQTNVFTRPAGALLADVQLNRTFATFAGKFVNPAFVNPEQINGLFNLEATEPIEIDFNDPLKPGGTTLAIGFSIKNFEVQNDVIGQLVAGATNEVTSAVRRQTRGIPLVNERIQAELDKINIDDEVKDEISDLRGEIASARVVVRDGVATSNVTFTVQDPRARSGGEQPVESFPLTFNGTVGLANFEADLSLDLPRPLLDKWIGGDVEKTLVDIVGEDPLAKIVPNGLTIGIDGTTFVPVPDGYANVGMACGS